MTKVVKNAGRGKYQAQKAKHDQRTPLPPRGARPYPPDEHTTDLRRAAGKEEEED